MAVKYRVEYKDVVNVDHKLDIYDDTYSDPVIEINGRVFLDASSTDDHMESIRGQGLRAELEANTDLTYSDLFAEEERTFEVKYYRDSVELFNGWLTPEGWYESFVADNWIVSFDCVDGLNYLEHRSFVETDGTIISGKITQLEAITKALARTDLQKDIYTSIDIHYTGLATNLNVLDNVYIISDRYIEDDKITTMSCEKVLRDILEPYGAVLKSYGDAWWIYRPNKFYETPIQDFFAYDYTGTPTAGFSIDLSAELGSHVNQFYPHHANENQSIEQGSSIGAYRINYRYGNVAGFWFNTKLISYDGTTITDWNIISTTDLTTPFPIGTGGVEIIRNVSSTEQLRSAYGTKTDTSKTIIDFRFTGDAIVNYQVYISDQVLPGTSPNVYYLQNDGTWGSVGVANTLVVIPYSGGTLDVNIQADPKPMGGTGYIYISFFSSTGFVGTTTLEEVNMYSELSDSDLEGEFHTLQRISKPSAQIKNIKEVSTGDNALGTYLGTLFKNDQTTPTTTWSRDGFGELDPILKIMGSEMLRMYQSPARIFRGDVFGFIDYRRIYTIDGFDGLFMVLECSYDTYANITSMMMRQILSDSIVADILYRVTEDRGNKANPTIKG